MNTVSDILDSKTKSENQIGPDMLVIDALRMLQTVNLSYLIVLDGNQYKGIFSERELEILQLLIEGFSSTEIGEKLFISLNTVNTHRKSLMKKAEVKKTIELISFAKEKGYI